MKMMLWFLLCGGYWIATGTAGKQRRSAEAVLSFLDGFYLAMLCFAILPLAMEKGTFYLAAVCAGVGIAGGFYLERWGRTDGWLKALLFTILTAVQFLQQLPIQQIEPLVLAVLGGTGLYHASASIIPDKIDIGKALLNGAGFLFGTFLFINL